MPGQMTPIQRLEAELVNYPTRVLIVAGAGVACATDPAPCASWVGLVRHGLDYCRNWCSGLPPQWFDTMSSLIAERTAEGLIQAATRIERALRGVRNGLFGQWLADSIGQLRVRESRVVGAIHDWGVRIATLNYDSLFEQGAGLLPITWVQGDLALRMLRGDAQGVLHLHGFFSQPDTVVFGARSYEDVCRDPAAQNLLRACFTMGTVVFVGCGSTVEDPNFEGLWEFCRGALRDCQHSHFHLARTAELVGLAEQYAGLPVTPLAYGEGYADLVPFLEGLGERVRERRRPPSGVDLLRRSQADYQSRMDELQRRRPDLSAVEFVRGTFDLARALWSAGGRRTAALAMDQVLMSAGGGLPTADQLVYGLEAAERLLDDGLDFHAATRLEQMAALLSREPAAADLLTRFRVLFARALSARAALDQTLRAIEAALPVAAPDERSRLEAERAELHLLNGDLDSAERAAGEGANG